jgi:porphobilinogen synthase
MHQPRRLRYNPTLRTMLRDVSVSTSDLVLPLFIKANCDKKTPIASMPGHFQLGLEHLPAELTEIQQLGIPAILLFGIPAYKDAQGSAALQADGIIQQALKVCQTHAPDLVKIVDLCFCEYTDHGHCGILNSRQQVDNQATLPHLAEQAISLAQAGADVIAPSANQDNMVHAIRQGLDAAGYSHLPILSYAVKYCSALYGPFRQAAEGAPQIGDRSSYQMDYARRYECLQEAELDIAEGADMLMVKPGMFYLDIIHQLKTRFPQYPLAAYQVSGEYAMLSAAIANGWLDQAVIVESVVALKRAGADIIISYFSKTIAKYLQG